MTAVKHCARCGKRLPAAIEQRVYSHFTRSYYCAEVNACSKRARRRKREKVVA